ncbi:OmpA family protein [Nemorincola caseinilytica]|uniref:OmpA family protein n=1 Tax=Nemorincola caseinilytica TaxID=2054315 RepID=A0ABP8NE50_9BACT
MYRIVLYIASIFFISPVFAQRATDTFKLYFDLDVPTLNEKMQKKIDLLIYNDKIISGSKVTIVGYADYLGTETYNQDLSMKRAQGVKDYLVKYGSMNEKDITLCVGRGKVNRKDMNGQDGSPTDRRVDIVVNNRSATVHNAPKPKPGKKDTIRRVTVTDIDDMKALRVGSVFKLNNVYFPADRHVMKQESKETLEKLYTVLKNNPKMKISIEGHVCCIRDAPDALDIDTYEPFLSVNRAKAIYKYLVDKGIEADRLSYVGFGRRRPVIANEQTEEDADKNRRVEIRIMEN